MNDRMQKFARAFLKDGLSKLTEGNRDIFKRMYCHKNLDLDINEVVDNMEPEKLDWAMQQVGQSLDKMK